MKADLFSEIREDCLIASSVQTDVRNKLGYQHIAVTGGTGFVGTWIAEMVSALNDEYRLGITLDLYARDINHWIRKNPHLAVRSDIQIKSQDVRSPFEFSRETSLVVHAAGIPNNRVHASDPLRVYQTTITGINNALDAASQLDNLTRFLNISSCLVNGSSNHLGALAETQYFPIPSGQLHTVYIESKRAAENLAAIYRSQFRMPITTIRPFTFAGPHQELDRPWAINNFMRDILTGGDIRIHGDGSARRSYLYGSDVAWWTLTALVNGLDGDVYNMGSASPITHLELVDLISQRVTAKPKIIVNTVSNQNSIHNDLFPDISITKNKLGVDQTCSLEKIVDKTWRWYSRGID